MDLSQIRDLPQPPRAHSFHLHQTKGFRVRLGHYKGSSPGNEGLKNALTLLMEAVPES